MDDVNSEKIELVISDEMDEFKKLPAGSAEKLRQAEAIQKLIDSKTKSEAQIMDAFDKQETRRIDEADKKERRRIEKRKNERLADIEECKTKLTPGKAILEACKFIVPAVVGIFGTILCIGASKDELDETLKFEETGRINSSGGRSHKRPNFWNKH